MTVAELIAALQGMPQDAAVLVYHRETETHHGDAEPLSDVTVDHSYVDGPCVVIW